MFSLSQRSPTLGSVTLCELSSQSLGKENEQSYSLISRLLNA